MKGYIAFCAMVMAVFAVTHAASIDQAEAKVLHAEAKGPVVLAEAEAPVLQRMRRGNDCKTMEDYRECDRFCRRMGMTGGACVRNKCDCDRW